jgi:crotonobetainyl-CoA:carnitine CoA-transferase CaiB-like acyl-CoA transferase
MNPATLLEGVRVAAPAGDDPAVATAVRHLSRLGATVVPEGADADIVLSAETHALLAGGLVGSETTAQAALGLTSYIGRSDGTPARTGSDVASCVAGFCGVLSALASLHAGVPRPIEVPLSPLRALSALKTILWAARSRPDAWSGTHVRSRERDEDSGYATADRPVTLDFAFTAESGWRSLVAELELDAATVEEMSARWAETVGWGDDVDLARPGYEARLRTMTSEDAVALIRRHGGSSVPFLSPREALHHPQAEALGLPESLARGLPWRMRAGDRTATARSAGTGDPDRPLAGVRVVDFGVGGVGPFSATLLAWLGADVVKVEAPNEFILAVRPTVDGMSSTYLALNQGKRSVSLDLKSAEDLALARELVAGADVLVENFRPGALDRLGLGFDAVTQANPGLVYCSATGFGWTGPMAGEPCTDPHMQAFSGFATLNADPATGRPRRIRYYGFVDLVTSCVIAEAVTAALLARRRDGGPVRVETSMLHAATEIQWTALDRPGAAPDGIFATAAGYVALTCRDDAEWARLVDVLGRPAALADGELRTAAARRAQRARVDRGVTAALGAAPAAAWAHALGRADIPCVRVAVDEDVLARRDLWDAGVLRDLRRADGPPLVASGPPWGQANGTSPAAPTPGADTATLRAQRGGFWLDS